MVKRSVKNVLTCDGGACVRERALVRAARRVACALRAVRSHLLQCARRHFGGSKRGSGSPCDGLPCARPQLDGHVIEQCVQAGDGHFKEGAWVKISEEYQNHPELQQLSKFVGKYGRLTRRYHGCAAARAPRGAPCRPAAAAAARCR